MNPTLVLRRQSPDEPPERTPSLMISRYVDPKGDTQLVVCIWPSLLREGTILIAVVMLIHTVIKLLL